MMTIDEEFEQWLDDSLSDFWSNIDYELELMADYLKSMDNYDLEFCYD